MSSTSETLAELRAFLARVESRESTPRLTGRAGTTGDSGKEKLKHAYLVPLGHGGADEALGGGLRRGALHEVFGRGPATGAATAFVCALAQRLAQESWLLWVQQDFAAHESGELGAEGLAALGLDPERLLIARVADATDGLRAAAEGLACSALGCVLLELWGEAKAVDLLASRRLTLAAQASGVSIIALRLGAEPRPSTAETRWIVRPAPSLPRDDDWGWPCFDVELARNRQGGLGRWIMEWSSDEQEFQSPPERIAPAAQPVDPAPADRPAEARGGAAGQGG